MTTQRLTWALPLIFFALLWRETMSTQGGEVIGSKRVARVWKNGVPGSLSNGFQDASPNTILVFEDDVDAGG